MLGFATFTNPDSNRYLYCIITCVVTPNEYVDLACVSDGEFYSLGTNIFG